MQSAVEQIKERLSIADVVGTYVKLEKAGSNLKARCPFHNEKTPSFFVSPSRETFHCFGCNRGGDVISFVEEIENIDFREALVILAERAGVELKRESPRVRNERERIILVLEEAAIFFTYTLNKNPKVVTYLKKRGLTDKSIKEFQIGYALPEWRALSLALKSKGFSDIEMQKAGLVTRSEKSSNYYDTFRGRIMFPVWDTMGRIVGFSGRHFEGVKANANKERASDAKYVNTPETDMYKKSQLLYGYTFAREAMRGSDSCVVVEGQLDVILSHQSGILNVVAPLGTALTSSHLRLIHRVSETLILAYDSDDAGRNAALRGANLALQDGFNVEMARFPDGEDPADVLLKDPQLFSRALDEAVHIINYTLEEKILKISDTRARIKLFIKESLPLISRIPSVAEQALIIKQSAERLDIKEDALWEELKKYKKADMMTVKDTEQTPSSEGLPHGNQRKKLIGDRLLGILVWTKSDRHKCANEIESMIKDNLGNEFHGSLLSSSDERKRKASIVVSELYSEVDKLPEVTLGLVNNLRAEFLKDELTSVMYQLKKSEEEGKERDIEKSIKKCHNLILRISELKEKIAN